MDSDIGDSILGHPTLSSSAISLSLPSPDDELMQLHVCHGINPVQCPAWGNGQVWQKGMMTCEMTKGFRQMDNKSQGSYMQETLFSLIFGGQHSIRWRTMTTKLNSYRLSLLCCSSMRLQAILRKESGPHILPLVTGLWARHSNLQKAGQGRDSRAIVFLIPICYCRFVYILIYQLEH